MLLADLLADGVEVFTDVAGPRRPRRCSRWNSARLVGRWAEPGLATARSLRSTLITHCSRSGMAPTPAAASAVTSSIEAVKSAMNPWAARHRCTSTSQRPGAIPVASGPEAYERLRRIKAAVDPRTWSVRTTPSSRGHRGPITSPVTRSPGLTQSYQLTSPTNSRKEHR